MSTIDSGHYEAHYGGEEGQQEAVLVGRGEGVALTTNRSMYPKGLSRRPPESRGRHTRSDLTALVDQFDCAKSLD